jgi:hypothetical protein
MSIISTIRSVKPTVIISWFPYPQLDLFLSQGWDDLGFHPDHQVPNSFTRLIVLKGIRKICS